MAEFILKQDLVQQLKEFKQSSIRDTVDRMDRIINKDKKKSKAMTQEDWISDVMWISECDTICRLKVLQ